MKHKKLILEILGWYGVAALVFMVFSVNTGLLNFQTAFVPLHMLVITGGFGLAVRSFYKNDLPSGVLTSLIAIGGFFGLLLN